MAALTEAVGGAGYRSMRLVGRPEAFCSGAHFDNMDAASDETAHAFFAMMHGFAGATTPVVAVCEGPVVGGGWLLAGLCPVVIARPETEFRFPELRMGLPSFFATAILKSVLPPLLYERAVFLGEGLSGAELAAASACLLGDDLEKRAAAVERAWADVPEPVMRRLRRYENAVRHAQVGAAIAAAKEMMRGV